MELSGRLCLLETTTICAVLHSQRFVANLFFKSVFTVSCYCCLIKTRFPIAFVSQFCGSMNDGHDDACNMELLYSESLFHFGLPAVSTECVPIFDGAPSNVCTTDAWPSCPQTKFLATHVGLR